MTKVLVATQKPFASQAVISMREVCEKAGFEMLLLEKYNDIEALKEKVSEADALIVRSDLVTAEVFAAAPKLKIVVRAGAGYDNVDLEAATKNRVVVMNTPGQNSNAVAELAIGMMIYQARNHFNGKAGTELKGKKIGIHAYGHVGKIVARIAKGFGMNAYAYDPFVNHDFIEAEGVTSVDSVEELYSNCQYISLHIPANDKTRKSINYELMAAMPQGATLVNTARKEVICEESLQRVFNERTDFHYVSDIAPDCAHDLSKFEGRYYFTPKKMGAQTAEANINAGIAATQQIVGFLKEGDETYRVN